MRTVSIQPGSSSERPLNRALIDTVYRQLSVLRSADPSGFDEVVSALESATMESGGLFSLSFRECDEVLGLLRADALIEAGETTPYSVASRVRFEAEQLGILKSSIDPLVN